MASNALVASSCDSYCTKAKFLLILTFNILPYGSKCLSMSFGLVLIGSKLITNKVFEGLVLAAEDLLGLACLLPPRSCCKIKLSGYHCANCKILFLNHKEQKFTQTTDCLPWSIPPEVYVPFYRTLYGQVFE